MSHQDLWRRHVRRSEELVELDDQITGGPRLRGRSPVGQRPLVDVTDGSGTVVGADPRRAGECLEDGRSDRAGSRLNRVDSVHTSAESRSPETKTTVGAPVQPVLRT
jgi:hypothetical protein